MATGVFGVSLARALGSPLGAVSPAASGPVSVVDSAEEKPSPTSAALSSEVIAMAAARAPFESDRRPPPAYRMPEDRVEVSVRSVPDLPDPPEFELLGAVSAPEGGFVVMRVDGGDPQLLREGEVVEGYQVSAVEADHAVIAGPGRSWQVQLASESPTVDRPVEERSRRRRGNDDDDDEPREIRISPEIMERVGNVMRQMPGFQGGPVQFGDDGSIRITAPAQGNGPVIVRQNVRGNR